MAKKVVIVELKGWRPYLSEVPNEALMAVDYALKEKYSNRDIVTEKIVIKVEIMEAL